MFNIICVKIGSKYSSDYVNRLYSMCVQNITRPFKFFCYTDNANGIESQINTIPFVDFGLQPVVYNKLFLFSKQFNEAVGNDNPCCFFDLDIVFKQNIDTLFDSVTSNLRVVYANWKHFIVTDVGWPLYDHKINSSCMMWKPSAEHRIWEKFIAKSDFYTRKYHRGMDPFLFYEFNIYGGLPEDMFYSFLYGVDLKQQRTAPSREFHQQVMLKTPIVLFNGPTTDQDVEDFIKSGYKLFFDPRDIEQRYRDQKSV